MPAGWVAAGAAVLGAATSVYGSKKSSKTAKKAGEREGAASTSAIARQEAAYEEAKTALQPYARQEQAASTQMMAQMGLAPPAGGGAPVSGASMGPTGAGGDAWGFGAGGVEKIDPETFPRTGDVSADQIRQVFREYASREPTDYELSYYIDHGGASELHRDMIEPGPYVRTTAWYDGSGPTEFKGEIIPQPEEEGAVPPGAPGTMGAGAPGDPEVQNIQSIMERAGADQLPPELREQYMGDLAEDPRTDPELAGYLGLTPESLQVGAEYQETPAYMAAREAGIETVDAAAAGRGGLYSGRRGRALRDVGQQVEQQYYTDAMNRREQMMGARRGERTQGIARRGATYEAGQQRGQSYYNNYMQMLNELSAPTTTTNIASMGTSLGKETSANIMGTARNLSDLEIGAAGAEQAAMADVSGGMMNMASAYLGPRGK